MAITFTTTSQLALVKGIKAVIYGPAGIGKTFLAASAPTPLLVNCEAGTLSLAKDNIERVWGKDRADINYDVNVVNIQTVEDLKQVYDYVISKDNVFTTIIFDSISEIAEVVLENAKPQSKDARQAYGAVIAHTEKLIRQFRDIEHLNIVFIAKEEFRKDDTTGKTQYQPKMPGSKLGNSIPYLVDIVLRYGIEKDQTTKEDVRFLQTQPDFQYTAKDRSGKLEAREYPHLGYIFNKIRGIA